VIVQRQVPHSILSGIEDDDENYQWSTVVPRRSDGGIALPPAPAIPPHMRMHEEQPAVQHVVGRGPKGRLEPLGLHPWKGMEGFVAIAPDIGVVPFDCVGLVFESSDSADMAYDKFRDGGYVVALPKPMPTELPPWVLLPH
jgi:hypothetical protein